MGKIGITCRQPFLGADEWIKEEIKKAGSSSETVKEKQEKESQEDQEDQGDSESPANEIKETPDSSSEQEEDSDNSQPQQMKDVTEEIPKISGPVETEREKLEMIGKSAGIKAEGKTD